MPDPLSNRRVANKVGVKVCPPPIMKVTLVCYTSLQASSKDGRGTLGEHNDDRRHFPLMNYRILIVITKHMRYTFKSLARS